MKARNPMKNRARKSTLCLVLLVLAAMILFSRFQTGIVHAASPHIIVRPSSGTYPITLSLSGGGYESSETVQLYWNYTGPGTGTLETTAQTSSKGIFTVKFPVPLAAKGTYIIAVVGETSGLVGTNQFTLVSSILAVGGAGLIGQLLTIHGYAFNAGETVNLYWNYVKRKGNFLATVATDSTGSFTTTITVPSSPTTGFSQLAGVGQNSQALATYPVTIYTPTLALAPLSGAANSVLTISAYGFMPFENVNIYWNNGTTPVLTGSTDDVSYLAPVPFTVPAGTAAGAYTVSAVGQTSHITITTTYTVVAPTSSLSIAAAPVGIQVAVTGQGYTASELIDILWNYTGPGTGTNLTTVTAGLSGSVNATILVPAATLGTYPVAVVGRSSQSVSQSAFTVSNGLAAIPARTPPGTNVTVTGMGFTAYEAVALYWNSTSGPLLATVTADATGAISQLVTIPTNATLGSNSLIGVGQSSQLSFTAPLTVNTDWSDFGFDYSNRRSNPYEQQVNAANVGNLVSKWTVKTIKPLEASPIVANGLVYIPTTDGQLDAYNATSGAIVWHYNTNTGFPNYSSVVVDPVADTVFFGTNAMPLVGLPSPAYALDAQTGVLKWSLILPWDDYGFPTLALNTIYIGTSNEGGNAAMMAIDEASGAVDWQIATVAGVWGAMGVDPANDMVFTGIGNPTDAVVARNATTGAFLWQYNIPQYGPDNDVGSAITVDNGRVYTDSKNGYFYALNENDGSLAWSTLIGTPSDGNISSAALANGVLYVGSRDHNLYALNESNGSILWKTATGADVFSSPAIANGVVYVASIDKKFYALDATSGTVLWSFTTGGKAYSSPVMVNGYLYCASTDNNLYAFGL